MARRFLADTTPLREAPAFRRLWWGLGVSNLGAQLTVVAVGLQVYDLTGSTLAVGILGVCAVVPLIALGLYGGALVDAHDRRRVALFASTALWVVTGLIAAQAWLHLESVYALYALVGVQSAAQAINNPARSAIIPRLVRPELLPAANALQTLAWNIALTVGPLAGAALVAGGGYQFAYTIDAVMFTAALWAVWRLPAIRPGASSVAGAEAHEDGPAHVEAPNDVPPAGSDCDAGPSGRSDAQRPSGSKPAARPTAGWRSVFDGLRFLATRPNVRMTFIVDLCAMVLAYPIVLFPAVGVVWIGGGSTTTGILSAAFAAGGVLAGLFSGGLSRRRRQGRVIVGAITMWGVLVAVFGVVLLCVGDTTPATVVMWGLITACLVLVAAGASDAVSAVFRQTILQAATPDEMRGRLQGVFFVVVAGGPRLGQLVVGSEAALFGEGWAAVIGGLTCVFGLWLAVRLQPRFWAYDAQHPEP